eukprot:TRINITY_DN126_c0_g1_i1.p1 TRINITY_DN126_c0_g1~~TRINITY_DN126_c0_g1_i1.p1  ORF type:complete len:841 (+),score=86.73 TRINITY_DN126_c0_g1_i1:4736-7258(+)
MKMASKDNTSLIGLYQGDASTIMGRSMAQTDRVNNHEVPLPGLSDPPTERLGLNNHEGSSGPEPESESEIEEEAPSAAWKMQVKKVFNSIWWSVVVVLFTIYALFSDDVRMLAFDQSADFTFYTITCITMGIFSVNIVTDTLVKQNYFLGLFFWLDFISTLSLLGDIGWVIPEDNGSAERITDIAKSARAGRIARIVRLIRMLRIIRITKLYKEVKDKQQSLYEKLSSLRIHPETGPAPKKELHEVNLPLRKSTFTIKNSENIKLDENDAPKESRISKLLSKLTTQRVVVLILLLVACLPAFQSESYTSYSTPNYYAGQIFNSGITDSTICSTYVDFQKDEQYPLIFIDGPGCHYVNPDTPPSSLRVTEKDTTQEGNFTIIVDIRSYTQLESILSICWIIFICVLLMVGAIVFSYDTHSLVVVPFESMFEKIRLLSQNPMTVWDAENEDEIGAFTLQYKMEGLEAVNKQENYETFILENVIRKIAKLLAVEFGEAGCKIITENLAAYDYLNPITPGTKIYGIFGFIQILDFVEMTERLQTKVIKFVNQIAEVVHATVDKCKGSTNKNIGDGFFVYWKFDQSDILPTPDGFLPKTAHADLIVELAIYSFIKIIAKIAKLKHIRKRKAKIALGIHAGWAIEGSIGSVYKIDVSYLSPNVNIASRLAAATKQYGVPILISEHMYDKMPKYCRNFCREIDIVKVKGSTIPLKLYTIDLDTTELKKKYCKYSGIEVDDRKFERTQRKKQFITALKNDKENMKNKIIGDKDVIKMRSGVGTEFCFYFKEGYVNYLKGNWNQCIESFKKALLVRPRDGPTLTLMAYIESLGCNPPVGWRGYRTLTEK